MFSNSLQGLKKQSALTSVFKERLYWNNVLSGSQSAQTQKKKDACVRLSIPWKVNSTNCREEKKCDGINRRIMWFLGFTRSINITVNNIVPVLGQKLPPKTLPTFVRGLFGQVRWYLHKWLFFVIIYANTGGIWKRRFHPENASTVFRPHYAGGL